jgi:hypothetical protein
VGCSPLLFDILILSIDFDGKSQFIVRAWRATPLSLAEAMLNSAPSKASSAQFD